PGIGHEHHDHHPVTHGLRDAVLGIRVALDAHVTAFAVGTSLEVGGRPCLVEITHGVVHLRAAGGIGEDACCVGGVLGEGHCRGLQGGGSGCACGCEGRLGVGGGCEKREDEKERVRFHNPNSDRKSTRLNSSH